MSRITIEEGEKLLRGLGPKTAKPLPKQAERKPAPVLVDEAILTRQKSSGVTVEEGLELLTGKKGKAVEDKPKPKPELKPKSEEKTNAFKLMEQRLQELDERIEALKEGA